MTDNRPLSIAVILRDAQLGDLRTLGEASEPYDLFGATTRLFELLDARGIAYVLVGGIAMLQYVDGRNTRDIDLIMSPADLDRLPEFEISSRDRDFARANFEGVQIDVLLSSNAVFDLVRAGYTAGRAFAEREITCATPAGLFLLKLFALPSLYRQRDTVRVALYENDLRMLLDAYQLDTEQMLKVLTPHLLASDIEQLRQIVKDIATRTRTFE